MHRGFTLIELIFSLFVISIVLLTLPNLFTQSTKAIEEIIKSEAVNEALTQNLNIFSYFWDENSVDENNISFILDTQGDSELARYPDSSSRYRRTYNPYPYHRIFFANKTDATSPSNLGAESGETSADDYEDVDDFNNVTNMIVKQYEDYIIDRNLSHRVYYIDDSADYSQETISLTIKPLPKNRTTNIKMIETRVQDPKSNQLIVVLRSFCCNVGMSSIERKSF